MSYAPGLVVGPEEGGVERERLAEGQFEARLDREPEAVRGLGGAVAGLEVLGRRLLIEELAARVDALDPHAPLEIGTKALLGPEDAGDAGRTSRGAPIPRRGATASPSRERWGPRPGPSSRTAGPCRNATFRTALPRDPEIPSWKGGFWRNVPVLAVGRPEAEAAVEVPGGRWRGERRSGGARRGRGLCGRRGLGGGGARRARGLRGGGNRQARGEHDGAQRPKLNKHV